METILKALQSKYNELKSLLNVVEDDVSKKVIQGKMDTLDDNMKLVKSVWTKKILDI